MNGFFGYWLRTWFDRARSTWFGGLFGFCLLIVAVESPLCLFFVASSWFDSRALERLTTEGILAEATVESVDFWHLHLVGQDLPGGMVDLNLAWTDAAGLTRRQKVTKRSDFNPKIVWGRRVLRSTLPIKYLPDERDAEALLLDDADRQNKANIEGVRFGVIGLGLSALALAILYAVRRYVRGKYPGLPASFTSWPDIRAIRARRAQKNSFRRVFWRYKQYTIPLLGGFAYGLKYTGLFDAIESLTGLSEIWTWFIVIVALFYILDIAGECHDRYGEWRSQTPPQNTPPSVTT